MSHSLCVPGRAVTTVLVIMLSLTSASARAQMTKGQCVETNARAQHLRTEGKLSEARELLRKCADPACPIIVRSDCTKRIDEMQSAQPTITFGVKDAAGNDVIAVKVTVDGKPLADKLDGTALPVDPGQHVFTFEIAGQPPLTRTLVVAEGEKERRELIVIGSLPKPATPAAPVTTSDSSQDLPAASPRSHFLEWALIGGGAAVAAAGAVLMVVEASRTSDAANSRDRSAYDSALSGWRFALAGTIVGAVAAASGGVVLVLSRGHEAAQSSRGGVWLDARAGTLQLGGTW